MPRRRSEDSGGRREANGGVGVGHAPRQGGELRGEFLSWVEVCSRSTWEKLCPRTVVQGTTDDAEELPRKEVIQPHLPVRLPCYDFVPIAGSALDGSPPCGSGHRLQAFPTFMT